MRFKNLGTEKIASNDLVKIGDIFGIASVDILPGGEGAADLEGVFEVPCTLTGDAAQGQRLYFKEADKTVTDTAAGNIFCGICFETCKSDSASVLLKIGYVAGNAAGSASASFEE